MTKCLVADTWSLTDGRTGSLRKGRTDGRTEGIRVYFSLFAPERTLFNIHVENESKKIELIYQPKISKPLCDTVSVCLDVALNERLEWCLVALQPLRTNQVNKTFQTKVMNRFFHGQRKNKGKNLPLRHGHTVFYFNVSPSPLRVSFKHFIPFFSRYRTLCIGKGNFLCI
jgi:hypothetical protein